MRVSNSIYSLLHLDIKLRKDSLKSMEGKVSDALARLEILAAVVHEISEVDCSVKAPSWSKCDHFGTLDEPTNSTDANIKASFKKTKSESLNVPVEEKCPESGQFTFSFWDKR